MIYTWKMHTKRMLEDIRSYVISGEKGFSVQLIVLCFGSLGCVKGDVWKGLRKYSKSKENIKNVMKWCSISCIIGGDYIWRSRVKSLWGSSYYS